MAHLPPHKRPTNTVFQSYALFPHLSVEDNVGFGLKRKKVDKAEIKQRVAAELERVGLASEGKRRPLAFLFSKEHLLKKLEELTYAQAVLWIGARLADGR